MATKIAIRIKKSKKSADYFIIQPMPTGVECKPNGYTLGWVVHFFRKSVKQLRRGSQHFPYEKIHSFPHFLFPHFLIKGFGDGREFITKYLIYI